MVSVSLQNEFFNTTNPIKMSPCKGHITGEAGLVFHKLFTTLLASSCALGSFDKFPGDVFDTKPELLRDDKVFFDFIIVGGGTAGSVVASRLSEIHSWNILLVEAGGDPPEFTAAPHYHRFGHGTCIDWKFRSNLEEDMFKGFWDKKSHWVAGKVLGGSSTLGRMLYNRGQPSDYEEWAESGRSEGWSYPEIFHYFKKAEQVYSEAEERCLIKPLYLGSRGYFRIGRFNYEHPFIDTLMDAFKALGIDDITEKEYYKSEGYLRTEAAFKDGERMSTARGYITRVKLRSNFYVLKYATVTKILIDPSTKSAYGIEYRLREEKDLRRLRASKEVILSAGTVNSAKILMLSGIGPKAHLEKMKIKPIKDLPVGSNLQDHPTLIGAAVSVNVTLSHGNSMYPLDPAYEYLTRREGLFSNIAESEILAFLNTNPETPSPDLMMYFEMLQKGDTTGLGIWAKSHGLSPEIVAPIADQIRRTSILFMQPVLLKPKSRGTIRLASNDPFAPPEIITNYLRDPEDAMKMLQGIEFVHSYADTTVLKKYYAEVYRFKPNECYEYEFQSKVYWSCIMNYLTTTFNDYVGTNKMGNDTDPTAVVDLRLRVRGIKSLRIVDASIMPTIPRAPTLAATIAIAEKATDMVKDDWLSTDMKKLLCAPTKGPKSKKVETSQPISTVL